MVLMAVGAIVAMLSSIPEPAMRRFSAAVVFALALWPFATAAQEEPPPSKCVAIANALPSATYAGFTPSKTPALLLA